MGLQEWVDSTLTFPWGIRRLKKPSNGDSRIPATIEYRGDKIEHSESTARHNDAYKDTVMT